MRSPYFPLTYSSILNSRTDDLVTPTAAHIDANLCWEDIPWIRKQAPGIPIVVKGVGCVEDVEEAKRYGADGVVLVSRAPSHSHGR